MQQLFGQKVLNDFIQKQDEKLIENRWQKYKNFLAKKEKISSWIETDYQDGFLEDIFENCLGYISKTRSTDEHYTLEREKKNETNGQKADGALLVDGKVIAVIELKDQKTKDLDKKYNREESAVRQAFGYLQHNEHAKYVIVSNFNELRFYFDKATAYEQFFLFDLDYEGFKKLHTILSYESISKELPHVIKEKSLTFEQDISNQLYKDYTAFRTKLFENILKNNPLIDKLELLNATQKLIDRIVFILFGEDTDLLPKNTIGTIIQRQKEVKKLVKNFTLYDSYKVYFEAINSGDEDLEITMYNGGLFADDELLNELIIDDEVLDARAKILSAYNFGSDISVNILEHIFENSISELEEISAQLLESDFDKKQSKRKKDGVFYTPAYITEYIVQNTLGKLCEEKRESLSIGSETLVSPKNPKNPTKAEQQIKENLLLYKEWLLNLKILDPACGSGAFLNQALEYLLKEHKKLQNDLALMGDLFASYEVEKEVLEHNLYGVDINEGAVEIARLSLWLRTAKRGRPLTKLANKIKVGNSLIDDKTVVPNAFNWHAEFPEVFAQGGFDVVIGNPPYVRQEMLSQEAKNHFASSYETYHGMADLYVFFVERAFKLLKNDGKFSYIFPNKWMKAGYGKPLRTFLKCKCIDEIIDFGDLPVFEDATTYPLILTMQQSQPKESFRALELTTLKFGDLISFVAENAHMVSMQELDENSFSMGGSNAKLLQKLAQNSVTLSTYLGGEAYRGIATGLNEAFVIDEKTKNALIKSDPNSIEIIKPFLAGRDIRRYEPPQVENYLLFIPWHFPLHENSSIKGASLEAEEAFKCQYPAVYNHLLSFKDKLESRNKAETGIRYEWYALQRCAASYYQEFDKQKIMYQVFQVKPTFIFDTKGIYCNNAIWMLPKDDKVLLAILNSKIGWFLISSYCTSIQNGYQLIWKYLEQIHIPSNITSEYRGIIEKLVDQQLELNQRAQETKQNFLNELKLEKLTKKLQNFEELTFEEFVAEYTKALKLKFADKLAERKFKQEWQAIFENDKALTCHLKTEIEKTDKEIDKMVYELYGLSDDEVKIVEGI